MKFFFDKFINEENMFDLYDLKKLEENLNTFKIEGEKEMYFFYNYIVCRLKFHL